MRVLLVLAALLLSAADARAARHLVDPDRKLLTTQAIAFVSFQSKTEVWAGTGAPALFRSSDGGKTWRAASLAILGVDAERDLPSCMEWRDPKTGMLRDQTSGQVRFTRDGGRSWQLADCAATDDVQSWACGERCTTFFTSTTPDGLRVRWNETDSPQGTYSLYRGEDPAGSYRLVSGGHGRHVALAATTRSPNDSAWGWETTRLYGSDDDHSYFLVHTFDAPIAAAEWRRDGALLVRLRDGRIFLTSRNGEEPMKSEAPELDAFDLEVAQGHPPARLPIRCWADSATGELVLEAQSFGCSSASTETLHVRWDRTNATATLRAAQERGVLRPDELSLDREARMALVERLARALAEPPAPEEEHTTNHLETILRWRCDDGPEQGLSFLSDRGDPRAPSTRAQYLWVALRHAFDAATMPVPGRRPKQEDAPRPGTR